MEPIVVGGCTGGYSSRGCMEPIVVGGVLEPIIVGVNWRL